MPTSSEHIDYTPQLPRTAPQFLRDWAEARSWEENALIWSVGWYREPLTGLRERCARAFCTACGRRMLLDYEPGGSCHGCGYGPRLRIGGKTVNDHGRTECPECGATVTAEHISGATEYAQESAWPMTIQRAQAPGKRDRAVLLLWEVYKYFGKDGRRSIRISPYEAYIVGETKTVRCTKHSSFMYSHYQTEWRQLKGFDDMMKDITETVCPEGIAAATAGTTAENAHLELYLRNGAVCFPVSWVRLWQKHRNAETLLTGGAGGIVSNLIGQEKRDSVRGYASSFSATIPRLGCVRWKEQRPSRMLGMDRGELREAIALQTRENLGGKTWQIWLTARNEGKNWTLEDASALDRMILTKRLTNTARAGEILAPPGKVLRYLEAQDRRERGVEHGAGMLLDYWAMLRERQAEPWDAEDTWPEKLKRAHDRLLALREEKQNAELDARFARRAKKLAALEYHSGGLFIRAPQRAWELTAEGKILHHCVATYAERHAAGETAILFIRKEDAPESPFYTLEWSARGKRVVQNRGLRNCARTEEVERFEREWLAWVLAGCRRDKDGTPIVPKKGDAA